MDKTAAASAAKTAQDTIREALEDARIVVANTHLINAALASLKSLDGQEAELSRLGAERDDALGALELIASAKERGFGIDYARGLAESVVSKHSKEGQEVADNKG